jgi:N-acetylmuramoyl-L-alanine amidase
MAVGGETVNIIDLVDELPRSVSSHYKTRPLALIDSVVLHHSATEQGSPMAFADYHVNTNGWPGIGYHYVIGKKGEIWKTNNTTTISYHAVGWNARAIGICLVGNFDKQKLEGQQRNTLLALLAHLKSLGIKHLVGHRETGAKKSCPGLNVNMEALREEIGMEGK